MASSLPSLPGRLVTHASLDEVIDRAASELLMHARACVRGLGDFHLALSASPDAEPVLLRLMYDPLLRDLPWGRTHLWLVGDAPGRGAGPIVRELVAEPAGIPPEQFHAIDLASPAAAAAYEDALREALGWREKGHDRLDYVMLAPEDIARPAGPQSGSLVASSPSGYVGLTATMVNAARFIAVMNVRSPSTEPLDRLAADYARLGPSWPGPVPLGGELCWYSGGGPEPEAIELA